MNFEFVPYKGINNIKFGFTKKKIESLFGDPNKYNQGVTSKMRLQDKNLHWWYRAREQGADNLFPDLIYNNK